MSLTTTPRSIESFAGSIILLFLLSVAIDVLYQIPFLCNFSLMSMEPEDKPGAGWDIPLEDAKIKGRGAELIRKE